MGSQNIVNEEPHAVSSLEPPVELESVRESLHTMGISEEAPKELNHSNQALEFPEFSEN
jgi:hypothetical protein